MNRPNSESAPTFPVNPAPGGRFAGLRASIESWCAGRLWQVRVPILLYFVGVWVADARDPMHQTLFKGVNLGIHEVGHVVFGRAGDILGALGGSLLQCLAPLFAGVMFARQRDWFAIAFCFGWLSTNLFEVATYAGDAVLKRLPLVTPGGGEPIHDWNYILASMGWLRATEEIAAAHRIAAHLSMAACLAFGTWLVLLMMRRAPAAPIPEWRTPPFESAPRPRSPERASTLERASSRNATGTQSPRE